MRLSLYSLVFGNHLKAKETIFGHFNKIIAFLYKFFLTSSMRTPQKNRRSQYNFLMNLLAAMGAYCFFLCNSPNPIFSKAHQAATSMVARHYICIRISPFQPTLIPNSRF